MSHHDQGLVSPFGFGEQQVHDVPFVGWVEVSGWLVGENQFGLGR